MSAQGQLNEAPLDAHWQGVCDFLDTHAINRARTVAPREFGSIMAGARPYETAGHIELDAIDCVVFHKGLVAQLPIAFVNAALREMMPAFGNEVFAVYHRQAFEPPAPAEHINPFLAKALQVEARISETGGRVQPRALLVYAGNDRMICRDEEFRKFVAPSRYVALIGAVMAGVNVVAGLREAIRPAIGGRARILDYGAGIGLFAIASKDVMAADSRYTALECDPSDGACLTANIDLAGMYWCSEIIRNEPDALTDLTGRTAQNPQDFHRVATGASDTQPFDALHIDLGFGLKRPASEWEAFLADNRIPDVVLTRGLTSLPDAADASAAIALEPVLESLGYELTLGYTPTLTFANVRLWRKV